MNAEPISMWPAPEGYWKEEVIPGGPPPSGVWPPDFGPPDFPRESISDDDVDVIRAAWKAVREADEADLHLHRFEDAAPAAAAAAPAATAEAPAATVSVPNPSEAPEMPDAPEEPNLFGIGTYDATRSKNTGKAKGKSKDKSKGKSKGKPKGKNRGSRSDSSRTTWRQMYDYWKYDSA
jgi:hypothetical protein